MRRGEFSAPWIDVVVDEGGNELAGLRSGEWPLVAEVGGRTATWKRTGPSAWAILQSDGGTLVEVQLWSSLWRTNGTVSVDAELHARDAVAGALLMVYEALRIRDSGGDPRGPAG